jgi:hypothetical protein
MAIETLPFLNIGFNSTADLTPPKQLGAADLQPALAMLPSSVLPFVNAALAQLSPTMEIKYKCEGGCDDFKGITIDCARFEVTGTTAVGPVSVKADMIPLFYGSEPCGEDNKGKRKTRTFLIEWYLTASVSIPVVGGMTYTTSAFKFYEQTVKAPCCPPEGGGWF